jgi:hypothetical protein
MTINLTSYRNICLNLSKTSGNIRTHVFFPHPLRVLVGEKVFNKIIQNKGRKGEMEGLMESDRGTKISKNSWLDISERVQNI